MREALEGKVAKIISVREVAINLGAEAGVKAGMIFAILSKSPLPIKDPDTGEALGQFDREKVRVRAEEVHRKFSVCRTYEAEPFPFLSRYVGAALPELGRPPRSLKIEDSEELPAPLPEEQSYVKVGDRVRLVEGTG